ncbi:MAG: SPFH domain-containing protein [Bacteroidetes bacterium]|jgi:membrane protease subunit (stomatin/prohibitin family)|nr:SPFH domain-containing protein [Bacteroidota bacterium]
MPKLMEVLEYMDSTGDVMVKRIPDNGPAEIKWGAQLTIRESQEAIFFRDGKALDVFKVGRHILETQNIPVVGKWVTSFGYGPSSPFRAEVYFVGKQLFPDLKWGTIEPILFRDSELKMIRIRSHGSFSIQISDSMLFVNKVVGTRGTYRNDDIIAYLRSIVLAKLTNILGEELQTVFDLPTSFDDLNLIAKVKLKADFEGLGLTLHDFYLNSISVPAEVQTIIDQRSGMTAIGDMDEFMKYKVALALENASQNQGAAGDALGGGVGAGMGLGMGFMMPQMIQQTMSSNMQGGGETESAVDKLKKLKELLDLEIISEEEFKQKKSKLMDHI